MIKFTVKKNSLTPNFDKNTSEEEKQVANAIAQSFNSVTSSSANYKNILQTLNKNFQAKNIKYQNYIDDNTISQIESFYTKAAGIKAWDPQKQGADLNKFDAKFYAGVVPDKVKEWNNASKELSFGGKAIANLDITQKYPTLDSYLHSDYTFVGAPGGLPGKQRMFNTYTETLRAPTQQEQQVLRDELLGVGVGKTESLAESTAANYIDVQSEQKFGALSKDALKQTLDEYTRAMKQEQMASMYSGMGVPSSTSMKENIKNSILGDVGAGGFLGLGKDSKTGKGFSSALDKALGIKSSAEYNWQKWFDEKLTARYRTAQEITDPTDASKKYAIEQKFANDFIEGYLRPRFDTSKSMSEFISYMDVKNNEQNVLQTQLVSSKLKEYATQQAKTYLDDLNTKSTTRNFDPKFYWNPELLVEKGNKDKAELYAEQKKKVENAWDARNSTDAVKNGRTWKQLAYEYGVDLENKDDFARLHYQIIGKDKNYDPVGDTYTKADLNNFVQNDLATSLKEKSASLPNPAFMEFVSAQTKAEELSKSLNLTQLPKEYLQRFKELGVNAYTDPNETVKNAWVQILSTDPALQIREQIKALNEQQITPTQKELGYGYIQRASDEVTPTQAGGTSLYNTFKKSGYTGTEAEFYKDFFPDATEEDKNLTTSLLGGSAAKKKTTAKDLLGFEMPDFSDPFAAMGSISSMMDSSDAKIKQAETYKPKRSSYFDMFSDEEDAGAPSYFDF